MRVVPVPCLSDNYAYLVTANGTDAIVVDPSEAEPVLEALEREGMRLVGIVNTHHHYDHVGGNTRLRERLGDLPVYAHESDRGRVPDQTHDVREGEPFRIAGLELHPLHVPGHTLGAVAYHVDGALFTGDTLFIAGCGRLFEGTPAQMHASLSGKLAKLPPETRVYCGHEYTLANLRFAATVDPENPAIARAVARATASIERGEPTVPSTMADELATNPFLRVAEPALGARFGGTPVEVLAKVRAAKDAFH